MKTKSESIEEKLEKLIMMRFDSFTRRITNTWINPAKSRGYYEDLRRVFCKDGSPEGLYPACIVPQQLLSHVVVITPLWQFQTLLEAWKQTNPKWVKSVRKIAIKESGKKQ